MQRAIHPISKGEFLEYLHRCIPRGGWPDTIAVANSGGPDSTALLSLLTQITRPLRGGSSTRINLPFCHLCLTHMLPPDDEDHFLQRGSTQAINMRLPRDVLSIHINHNLQQASSSMAEAAAETAKQLGVRHLTDPIPWGNGLFPAQRPGEMLGETVTREARHSRLFSVMNTNGLRVIAFGHHADDQVETALMRMSQNSGERGLAAMRPVRRWGMGDKQNRFFAFGAEGMSSWIVRPFLQVPKDRLLATCEEQGLHYVNDPTNFQPDLTYRNTIRHILHLKEPPKTKIADQVRKHICKLREAAPLETGPEQLREAVRQYGMRLDIVDTKVTNILDAARLPSAPATLLLSTGALAGADTDEIRIALVRRCIRYISHGPWGSMWAEAGGERDTLQRTVDKLWPSHPLLHGRKAFTAGGGVLAIPVAYRPSRKSIRMVEPEKPEDMPAWIFARAPPYQKTGASLQPGTRAIRDVTDELRGAMDAGETSYRVLYDHRFTLNFDLTMMPAFVKESIGRRGARLRVDPDTRWVLPSVVLEGENTPRTVLAKHVWEHNLRGWKDYCGHPLKFSGWITMDFLRSLDAV